MHRRYILLSAAEEQERTLGSGMGKLYCLLIDIVSEVKCTLMRSPPLPSLFDCRFGSLAQETWPESET